MGAELGQAETDRLVAAALAAADVAGAVIRPLFRAVFDTEQKGDQSPVTIADRTAEQAMRAVLAQRFPEHGILGEEYGLDRPGSRLRWVLDPVDGTRAFITGRPLFGTLIGLLDGPTPILGVLDQPITGERWIGVAGRTTQFHGPYGRAGCRPCPALADAELSCTSPDMLSGPQTAAFRRLQAATRRTSWGGDCYGYGLVALGAIDVIAETGLKVWDWTALVPIIEGAGGLVRDWRGAALHPDGDGDVLALGDPGLLPQILPLLA